MSEPPRSVESIFLAALEIGPPEERARFVERSCDDPETRRRVERLLIAHEQAGSFLAEPAIASAATTAPGADPGPGDPPGAAPTATYQPRPITEGPGTRIGPYKLLQRIGEGGMGVVFMAEQEAPVRRKVALKVIKPGMDTEQVVARFEAERQALALMDHPNIARVLDAGATDTGRPYFVMELVKGVPITQYCDEARLSTRERLELFLPVCQAIQHAHQKGVIHRDVKPSNVLITLIDGHPVPKVIDFGVAKATDQRLTEKTLFTQFGAVIGTPEYMSPEQAGISGLDVDTRADVYALGVLLYELLTGSTPLERARLRGAAYAEILRLIREEEPPKPSTRLSGSGDRLATLAAQRHTEPSRLTRLVRGELDWIVMKALEKDRSRRYETASGFARDIQRHLDGDPVEAGPPSASYRLRKLARKYRGPLATAAAFVLVLAAAAAFSTWQAIRATRQEREAVESAAIADASSRFLINDLLGMADLERQASAQIRPDPDIKVRTLVDRAAGQIDGAFPGQPLVEAAVRYMVANVYSDLGLDAQSRPYAERALELRRQHLGETHRNTIAVMSLLGTIESRLSLHEQAEVRLRRGWELARRRYGEDDGLCIRMMINLANCLDNNSRYTEAERLKRRALELARQRSGSGHYQTMLLQNNLAVSLKRLGAEREAELLLQEALRSAKRSSGVDHPLSVLLLANLADIQTSQGRFAEAEQTAREAVSASRKLYGETHPRTCLALVVLAQNLKARGELDQAESVLRPLYEAIQKAHGDDDRRSIDVARNLGHLLHVRGRLAEAEDLLTRALASALRTGSAQTGPVYADLGVVHQAMGRLQEAQDELAKAEEAYRSRHDESSTDYRKILERQSYLLRALGRPRESLEKSRQVAELTQKIQGSEHPNTLLARSNLASACWKLNQLDEAEAIYREIIPLMRRVLGPTHNNFVTTLLNYGAVLHIRGEFERAEATYREGLDAFTRTRGPDDANALAARSNLGELYRDWGRDDLAATYLGQALEAYTRLFGPDNVMTLWILWKIAEMDRDRGRYDEAEAKFRRCIDGYLEAQGPDSVHVAMLRADLGLCRLRQGRAAEAEPLLREALTVYEAQMPDDWRRYEIQGQLGAALAGQSRFAEAEPLVLGGYEGLMARSEQVTIDARGRLPEGSEWVVRLYEAWGKPEEAAEWRRKLAEDRPRAAD